GRARQVIEALHSAIRQVGLHRLHQGEILAQRHRHAGGLELVEEGDEHGLTIGAKRRPVKRAAPHGGAPLTETGETMDPKPPSRVMDVGSSPCRGGSAGTTDFSALVVLDTCPPAPASTRSGSPLRSPCW